MLIRNVLLLIMILLAGLVPIVGQEKENSGDRVRPDNQANPSPEEMEYWRRQRVQVEKAEGVEIAIAPLFDMTGAAGNEATDHYLAGGKMQVKVSIMNGSAEPILMHYVDKYTHHRPRLFKDGQLVPYSKRAAEAVKAMDGGAVFSTYPKTLNPGEPTSETIDLSDWYDPLVPGSYQLMDRYRLILDGRWIKSPLISFVVTAK